MATGIGPAPRTALFLPASNGRAIEKARTLEADLIILDLEDAVREDEKPAARAAAVEAVAEGFGERRSAIRVNAIGTAAHEDDVKAVAGSRADFAVLPKAEDAKAVAKAAKALGKPLLAMIESPKGVLAAAEIAAVDGVAGLIAGTNDLRVGLGLPAGFDRGGMDYALQAIVLAARAAGVWAIDGVFNALDGGSAFTEECRHGRSLGFDGKALIHPKQVTPATESFGPSENELAEARALIAAATGGAERFEDRMIEDMHVEQAKALLARAGEAAPTSAS